MLRYLFCVAALAGWASPTETNADQPPKVSGTHPANTQPARKLRESTVAELTALVRKSVVVISYTGRDGRPKGVGSGFIISPDGLIATNLHVIGEARPIVVHTSDGKRHEVTSIHATESRMDLAIIKVDAKNLPALPLGDSDTLKQGQKVVALGNPRGLKFSVVAGVVSGRRKIDGKPVIQLAIPIEPGNSGGPLLDMQGRVHGILTLKSLVTDNLGFAVTINALKPLLKKPNPVDMTHWLTIGTMDPRDWSVLFGADWRQRAGRIHVEGRGRGIGGRSLLLSKRKPPTLPFEMAVQVKLDDEAGAAGLAFHAGGLNKHYGFYPSNGKLRLSRFEGPDVFSWKVLRMLPSRHYRPGEWNALKVRVEKGRIQCFVNDRLVIESTDAGLTSGQVGLVKFRDTNADFRGFRVAKTIPSTQPDAKTVAFVTKLVANIGTRRPPRQKLIRQLLPKSGHAGTLLKRRAQKLELQAKRLRQLARLVHESETRRQLAELFAQKKQPLDLLKAALLVARMDNP
ncbi:MAG: trypsin-like peptidase domain-containing protein, partial [Planctomycetaceae bacterium]